MKNKTTKTQTQRTGTDTISDASTTHYTGNKADKSISMLTIAGKRYINISEYARVKGISEWYARKLCRTGKVESLKVGQDWYIKK